MYLLYFIIGGLLFISIKYLSHNIKNIKYSSSIAAFPIGLTTILLITNDKLINYSKNYCFNLVFLLLTAIFNYILLHYYNKYVSLVISLLFWILINYIFIKFI